MKKSMFLMVALLSLATVVFPDSLKTIGLGAFSACSNLKHITLPEGLINIQMGAFIDAPLEELTIPSTVQSIHP